MTHREPTVRSRELGAGLRQAMQDAGLNGKQAARLLDVTPGYVSLLLSGKRGASELDLDSQTACLFLEEPEEIAAYQHILKVLANTALDEGHSRQLIAALATGLSADREDSR